MRADYRSGFVTLIGRPNVGKSTLMNYLIGQKIAITSNKPQTTRNRIQTVLTTEEGQIVFVDTPGIHKAKNKLGEYMVNVAERTLNEVDVVLWLVEPSTFIGAGERHIAEQLKKVKTPVILVINKTDKVKKEEVFTFIDAYKNIYDFAAIVPVSARSGENTDELIRVIMQHLPYGPQFYDEDTITDQPQRQIVAYFEDMGVGSTVEFSSIDGKQSIPVTISGVFSTSKMPVIFGHGRAHTDGSVFFAPKDLFYELYPEITTFDYSWSIVSNPKKAETVKAELKNIVAEHSNLALDEIDTAIAAEKSQNSAAFGSMQVLSWLVFLFGVINLINTTLSNQMSRKQENSVLRSIGLTQKQLCKMNICEGLCYAFFATLAILIVGFPISIVASREISIATFGGNVVPYKFPVLEMGLFILVLFGMELILSVWTIRRQKKQSLIEQMRAME